MKTKDIVNPFISLHKAIIGCYDERTGLSDEQWNSALELVDLEEYKKGELYR